jgi:hypothetical protein
MVASRNPTWIGGWGRDDRSSSPAGLAGLAGDVHRAAGLAGSILVAMLGAGLAWVVAGGSGIAHVAGLVLFVGGHVGLLATLTFTTYDPGPGPGTP